ncbi:MAG: NAD+ synthase [Bacteroidetes bacterium HGW-Bacteroidetes-6]|jgi:NAD+ synthase (glutamine-hydrolysing)|nr:MAG: NAD+ synthase [Bacteroidetes bacterium HGW-Bacteroidetes-6]
MKIALCQINPHTGYFEFNRNKILDFIEKSRHAGAHLAVFPELSLPGYPPRDFLDFDDFTDSCLLEAEKIASLVHGPTVVIGSPTYNKSGRGKMLHNSALLLHNGKIEAEIHKALLPNYDIFDEYRYFEPGRDFRVAEVDKKKLAITICEDLWNIEGKYLYVSDPMQELAKQNPDIIINIAASPFSEQQFERRLDVMRFHAKKYRIPVVYVNMTGAQTELIFDGRSMIVMPDGRYKVLASFQEDFYVFDTDAIFEESAAKPENNIELIHDALVFGIREYFTKLGFKKAVLGLSGGIDSAVVACLACEAIGSGNVSGLLMPSQFSSQHSVDDALKLAQNAGMVHKTLSIQESFTAVEATLHPLFKNLAFNIAEENIQARLRAVLLMAYSNKFGHILLNTSNKSEAAVGYGTLYGDMCGGLSVIGDLYKTQVYELAHYINRESEIIPMNIITKAPSAELRPNQKDSDSLPEYDILDEILRLYIEETQSPADLVAKGYEKTLVARIVKLVNTSEYKRYQSPPALRVSTKAFGTGRRLPIAAKYLS